MYLFLGILLVFSVCMVVLGVIPIILSLLYDLDTVSAISLPIKSSVTSAHFKAVLTASVAALVTPDFLVIL